MCCAAPAVGAVVEAVSLVVISECREGAPTLPVRAENLVHGSGQQSCSPCRPVAMITSHVPAVRVPPDCAANRVAAARLA
jgi:hypothetical protein